MLAFLSCKENGKVWIDKEQNIFYEVISKESRHDHSLEDFILNTNVRNNATHGISIAFQVEHSTGLTGRYRDIVFELTVQDESSKPLLRRSMAIDSLGSTLPCLETHCRYPLESKVSLFLPFYLLNVPAGENAIIMYIKGFPLSVGQDSASQEKSAHSFKEPSIELKVRLNYIQQATFFSVLQVAGFEVNTSIVDPHSYDFRVMGTGYPDMYCDIFRGEEMLTSSPIIQNTIKYRARTTTPAFYWSENDSITVLVYDRDDLSKHDLMGEWHGSPNIFKNGKTVDFDEIANFEAILLKGDSISQQ